MLDLPMGSAAAGITVLFFCSGLDGLAGKVFFREKIEHRDWVVL